MTGPFLSAAPTGEPAWTLRLDSPAGPLILRECHNAITRLHWMGPSSNSHAPKAGEGSPLLAEAARQLEAYFAGERQNFDLPLGDKNDIFAKARCERSVNWILAGCWHHMAVGVRKHCSMRKAAALPPATCKV